MRNLKFIHCNIDEKNLAKGNTFTENVKKKYSNASKLFKEDKNFINPYLFFEELSKQLKNLSMSLA